MKRILALLTFLCVFCLTGCSDHLNIQPSQAVLNEGLLQETAAVSTAVVFSDPTDPTILDEEFDYALQDDTVGKPKRLCRVEGYDTDGYVYIITFQYDDAGLMISSTYNFINQGEIYDDSYCISYVYDEDNRLLEVFHNYTIDSSPSIKYHYDENGYLIRISGYGEGGGAEGSGTYENDASGRLLVYSSDSEFNDSVTKYTYSCDGRRVSTEAEIYDKLDGTVSFEYVDYTYTYDTEGRIIAKDREKSGSIERVVYSYDYKPFVAHASPGELPYLYVIEDVMGHEIWSVSFSSAPDSLETDKDGYVTRIVCSDKGYFECVTTWDFFYEVVTSDD